MRREKEREKGEKGEAGSSPTSGLARSGRWRGALRWPGVCFSIFHSLASRREAQLCSVTGPNTIYDFRTPPPPSPDGMGKAGAFS